MGIQIIELFGQYTEKWSETDPALARRLLKTGWQAQGMKLKYLPNQALLPADRFLSQMMMNAMVKPPAEPEQSVIVSIFTPCELMQEAGLHPYSVESFFCFLSGSQAERGFCSRRKTAAFPKPFAATTRHFSARRKRACCRSPAFPTVRRSHHIDPAPEGMGWLQHHIPGDRRCSILLRA